jgi:hypothetical protein
VRGTAAIALVELGRLSDVRAEIEKDKRIIEDIKSVSRWDRFQDRAKATLKALGISDEER